MTLDIDVQRISCFNLSDVGRTFQILPMKANENIIGPTLLNGNGPTNQLTSLGVSSRCSPRLSCDILFITYAKRNTELNRFDYACQCRRACRHT